MTTRKPEGRWAVLGRYHGVIVVHDCGLTVAKVGRDGGRISEAAQEAHAHLIAAAPNLLAVCMDIVEADASGVRCPMRVVEAARMAVSKAQGEP